MPPKKQATGPALTHAQEEEMSSALIAQLLAEDGMDTGGYYAEYGNDRGVYEQYRKHDTDDSYEEESEDDYKPKQMGLGTRGKRGRGGGKRGGSRGASRGGGAPRGRKRKVMTSDEPVKASDEPVKEEAVGGESITAQPDEPIAAEKKEKKAKKPLAEGMRTGTYDDDEEARFLEGLELYGREWTKLAAHIATRDPNSIRSHAQKHFIKLYRDNIPLPEKVRATGLGYTLSGKELDPNSAAAKPYLARQAGQVQVADNDKPQEKTNEELSIAKVDPSPVAQGEKGVDALSVGAAAAAPEPPTASTDAASATPTSTISKKPKPSVPAHARFQEAIYDEDGRTMYSKARLRQPRERSSISYSQLNGDTDPLTMIKCEPFCGKPGSGVAGCQPFEMKMHSNVLVAMDFHAHLMTTEVIGFLAGKWNKEEKYMIVQAAYPCRSLNTGQNDVNVEMDPTSAIEVRQEIEEHDMQVVGWYHSHPTFVPDPSLMDIENQKSYQTQWRDEYTLEPFVGAIVGPYDPKLPGSVSVINWFYLDSDRLVPKRLTYDIQEDYGITHKESDRMFALLDEYAHSPEKVHFNEFWRQDAQESKLSKLIKSLAKRMPWLQAALMEVMRRQQQQEAAPSVEPAPSQNEQSDQANSEGTAKGVLFEKDPLTGQDVVRELFLEQVEERLKTW